MVRKSKTKGVSAPAGSKVPVEAKQPVLSGMSLPTTTTAKSSIPSLSTTMSHPTNGPAKTRSSTSTGATAQSSAIPPKKKESKVASARQAGPSSGAPPSKSAPEQPFLSRLGGTVDPDLNDVFSKSAAYSIPPPQPKLSTKPSSSNPAPTKSESSAAGAASSTSTTALPPKKRKRAGEEEEEQGKKVKKEKHAKRKEMAKAAAAAAANGPVAKPLVVGEGEDEGEDEDEEMGSVGGPDDDALVDMAIAELEAEADEEAEGELEDGESVVDDEEEGSEGESDEDGDDSEEADGDSDDVEVDPSTLVHESLDPEAGKPNKQKDKKEREKSKKPEKHVPETETPQERDRRTVFIGNVDVSAMRTKPGASSFRRHILQFCPSAKIESIRFRSIAFAQPTSELPDDSADTPAEEAEKKEAKRLEREKERARTWREEEKREREAGEAAMGKGRARAQREREQEKEDMEIGKDQKVFQLPGEKRKVAFIKKQFHAEVATVNAYVVFAHSPPNRSANVPPILDPYTAASQLVSAGHNSTFLGHTLRIDAVKRSIADIMAAAKEDGLSTLPAKRAAWAAGKDVKASLFVGNLDFATKDEDLRAFFESSIVTERGEPPAGTTWVVDVRIIRDRDTQLGKGFGYVNFQDRESVDEVLALPADKLKFAKRNLRVQSCKTLPSALGGASEKPAAAKPAPGKPAFKSAMPRPPPPKKMPKGDPLLGEKIAGLSKDERKAVKSGNADRLARRAAKKDAAKVKAHAANSRDKVKLDVRGTAKKGAPKIKAKQGRVRSANALKKMKGRAD